MIVATVSFAQRHNNPFSYPYYISGVTEIDANDGDINLKNVKSKGFEYARFRRGVIRNEKAGFVFDSIRTNPPISITNKRLQYWRQDKSGEWITDAEGGNGTFNDNLEKDITIVMALDCSTSLGSDFQRVKNGAISFLETIFAKSNDGHIKLGIIGFSSIAETERQTFEIKPLTGVAYNQARNFINSLETDSNTALYYAINKATDMLKDYVSVNIVNPKEYGGTYMLAFTDGIDNASQFRNEKIFRSEDAYEYAKNKLENTRILESHIEPYFIGVEGVDLKTENQRSEFRRILEGLRPVGRGGFIYLNNMSGLESAFRNIAENLVQQWQNLICYTSLAHEGGVCWTLGDIANYKNIFLGINVGAGYAHIFDETGVSISGGIDFAYPFTRKFGLGIYGEFSHVLDYEYQSVALGLLTTIGNYHDGKKAFVGGLGVRYNLDGDIIYPHIRCGVLFRNGLYLMGNISAGKETYGWNYWGYDSESFGLQVSLQIGFNLGKFAKVRCR